QPVRASAAAVISAAAAPMPRARGVRFMRVPLLMAVGTAFDPGPPEMTARGGLGCASGDVDRVPGGLVVDRVPDAVAQFGELWAESHLLGARIRQVDVDDLVDASGSGRHHDHTV